MCQADAVYQDTMLSDPDWLALIMSTLVKR